MHKKLIPNTDFLPAFLPSSHALSDIKLFTFHAQITPKKQFFLFNNGVFLFLFVGPNTLCSPPTESRVRLYNAFYSRRNRMIANCYKFLDNFSLYCPNLMVAEFQTRKSDSVCNHDFFRCLFTPKNNWRRGNKAMWKVNITNKHKQIQNN